MEARLTSKMKSMHMHVHVHVHVHMRMHVHMHMHITSDLKDGVEESCEVQLLAVGGITLPAVQVG